MQHFRDYCSGELYAEVNKLLLLLLLLSVVTTRKRLQSQTSGKISECKELQTYCKTNINNVSSVEKCPVRAGSGVVRIDPLRFLAGPPDVAKSD